MWLPKLFSPDKDKVQRAGELLDKKQLTPDELQENQGLIIYFTGLKTIVNSILELLHASNERNQPKE